MDTIYRCRLGYTCEKRRPYPTVTTKPRAAGNDKKRVAEITITNDKVDWQKDETQFKVADGDPNISGENYNYDDEITGWD